MGTPIYDLMAFMLDYDHRDDHYWTQPWLEFVRIAERINMIGFNRRPYRPFTCTMLFADGSGTIQGIAL